MQCHLPSVTQVTIVPPGPAASGAGDRLPRVRPAR